jgi:hypothetical protein
MLQRCAGVAIDTTATFTLIEITDKLLIYHLVTYEYVINFYQGGAKIAQFELLSLKFSVVRKSLGHLLLLPLEGIYEMQEISMEKVVDGLERVLVGCGIEVESSAEKVLTGVGKKELFCSSYIAGNTEEDT